MVTVFNRSLKKECLVHSFYCHLGQQAVYFHFVERRHYLMFFRISATDTRLR